MGDVLFVKRMQARRDDRLVFLPAYQQHLTQELTDNPPRDRDGFLSPSSLGRCMTQAVHQMNGEKKIWLPDKMAESQDLLDIGTMMHQFYQERGMKTGVLTNCEDFVELPQWKIRGQIDGILTEQKGAKTKRYLFEIKTVNTGKFAMVKKSNMPLREHWPQNLVYMKATGLRETRFLYVERDMLNKLEVPFKYDAEVMKKVAEWIRAVLKYHKTGKYPERGDSYWDKPWDCATKCHYHHACKLLYAANKKMGNLSILEDL